MATKKVLSPSSARVVAVKLEPKAAEGGSVAIRTFATNVGALAGKAPAPL